MAGIVHFSVFFIYMEEVEHELLRELGFGVICDVGDQRISFPRVNAQCNYVSAIRFEDLIDIELTVSRIGEKSITWQYAFSREAMPVANGSITTVCCKFHNELGAGRPEPVAIPARFVDAIQPYVVD